MRREAADRERLRVERSGCLVVAEAVDLESLRVGRLVVGVGIGEGSEVVWEWA